MSEKLLSRQPAVAGGFYEGSASRLRSQIEQCFLHRLGPGKILTTAQPGPRAILGLVCPHAGLMYSGPVAARAFYALAEDGLPQTIVLIGPNHRGWGANVAVWAEGSWSTPLGNVPVNRALAARIVESQPLLESDATAHLSEHSLEVQLPFLQFLAGERFSIVPIAMLDQSLSAGTTLGHALGKLLTDQDAVIIASTDFSHYVSQADAEKYDGLALERIKALDAEGLIKVVRDRGISMCGYGPVAAMLTACQDLGAKESTLLGYSTSGDIAGGRSEVVGYGAVKVTR